MRGLPQADAYLPWAQATGFRDNGGAPPQGQERWLWLLLELRSGWPAPAFFKLAWALHRDWIRLPARYAAPPAGLKGLRYCTAIVSDRMLAALQGQAPADPAAAQAVAAVCKAIARFEIGFAVPPWRAQLPAASKPANGRAVRAAPGPVIGVVDDGLAFANTRFCWQRLSKSGGRATRFLSLWDQGGHPLRASVCAYGRHYSSAELDRHIAASTDAATGEVDEDGVYARAGYREVRHRITHGTHVLDLAAGGDIAGGAELPHIVGVQVPGMAMEDTSCASTTVFLLDAVMHILAEADRAFPDARAGPALINISMGNIAGPHDGSSIFESALAQLIALRRARDPGFHVVMPAGNSLLSRCHAQLELAPKRPQSIAWRMQPADGTPNFVELWFRPPSEGPASAGDSALIDGLTLTLTPPNGAGIRVKVGQTEVLRVGGQTVALLSLHRRTANGRASMGLVAVAPTQGEADGPGGAPAGLWTIGLEQRGSHAIDCHAYVQRDDITFGRRSRARQSFFDDARYRVYTEHGALRLRDDEQPPSCVKRVGTFNGLATGAGVDIAGGALYLPTGGKPLPTARYSSVEFPALADRGDRLYKTVVTEDSPVLHGVLAAGTRSGSVVALSGTSMAAPQLLRAIWEGRIAAAPVQARAGDRRRAIDAGQQLRPVVAAPADVKRRAERRRGSPMSTSGPATAS